MSVTEVPVGLYHTRITPRLRDHILITLWFLITFKTFRYDELILYPLAFYFFYAFLRDLDLLSPIVARSLILFAFPLWWMLSFFWGVDPPTIVKSGLQLILTILICYCAIVRLTARDLMHSLLIASAYWGVLSLIAGLTGGLAQRGAFASKNAMGVAMVLLLISALCTLLDAKTPRLLRLTSVVAAALATYLILISDSATAMLLAGGILGVIFLIGLLPRSGLLQSGSFLATLTLGFGLGLTVLASYSAMHELDLITKVLDAFGKDTTLTGRTTLWVYAMEQIRETPLLGVGHGGFWTAHDWTSDARRIYDEFHKAYYATFSFHNSYFEIAVHQGLIGLAIAVAATLWTLIANCAALINRVTYPNVFLVCIAIVTLMSSLTEATLMAPFSLLSMIFVMGALLRVKQVVKAKADAAAGPPSGPAGPL